MSSTLALDGKGRRVVIVTTPVPGLNVGHCFLILGNLLHTTAGGDVLLFGWLGERTGRRPDVRERTERRTSGAKLRQAPVEADEPADEEAAIESCRREQQTRPADLIGRARFTSISA